MVDVESVQLFAFKIRQREKVAVGEGKREGAEPNSGSKRVKTA